MKHANLPEWLKGEELREIMYSELQFKKKYKIMIVDVSDFEEEKHKSTIYISFKATTEEDCPELSILKGDFFKIHFSENPFRREWKKNFKGKLLDGGLYNALITFERVRRDRFKMYDIQIIDQLTNQPPD